MKNIDGFYGASLSEYKLINRFKYVGRGRPKNKDYCTLRDVNRMMNKVMNNHLDWLRLEMYPMYNKTNI